MNKHPLDHNPYRYIILRQSAGHPGENPMVVAICDRTTITRFIGTLEEVTALQKELSGMFENENYFITEIKV